MTKKIIVIDDDTDMRDNVSRFLRKKRFDVETFSNSDSGFKYFFKNGADLMLIDHNMSEVNNSDFIRKFKKMNSKIICIGMSANWENETFFSKVGCYGFLKKPFKSEELMGMFRSLRFF